MPQGRKGVVSAFLGEGFFLPEVGGEAGAQGGRGTHCRRRSSHRRYSLSFIKFFFWGLRPQRSPRPDRAGFERFRPYPKPKQKPTPSSLEMGGHFTIKSAYYIISNGGVHHCLHDQVWLPKIPLKIQSPEIYQDLYEISSLRSLRDKAEIQYGKPGYQKSAGLGSDQPIRVGFDPADPI
ncbi:hypothetical protein Taro_017329 [Colocasia esculenta]|uniref:Uncharacterized protein n=1 Tax=Colocasia esculenta TaxID=4460 RepID=A0A843UT08_COLES|nr:hypothetical protein [Colocasia esculenta]